MIDSITMSVSGRSRSPVGALPIFFTTSIPSTTSPKTVWRSSRCGVGASVMKNCPPLVFGPRFAIDRIPGLVVPRLRMELVGERVAGSADPLAERIAALNHEAIDHAMKDDTVVVRLTHLSIGARIGPILRALREADEVFDCLWRFLIEQTRLEGSFSGDECGKNRHLPENITRPAGLAVAVAKAEQ